MVDSPEPHVSPEILLDRYRRTGEVRWLSAAFDATAAGLLRVALSVSPDAASAEDAVQETYLTALGRLDRFDASRPLLPWLVGILQNKVRTMRRTRRRQTSRERHPRDAVEEGPAALAMKAEDRERVRAALDELPEPYRSVGLLRWCHGLEPAEIAHLRGEPPGTVRSTLARALTRLRRILAALLLPLLLGTREVRGMARLKAAVLAHASRIPIPASPHVLLATGAVAMFKKIVLAGACLLLLALGGWLASSPPRGRASAPSDPTLPADVGVARAGSGSGGESLAGDGPSRAAISSELLWENSTISGRVQRKDGQGAEGYRVQWMFLSRFRVEHSEGSVVTDSQGRFRFPAVAGAPYIVFLTSGQPGVSAGGAGFSVPARGGDGGLFFTVDGARGIAVRGVDASTSDAIDLKSVEAFWENRRRRVRCPEERGDRSSFPGASGRRSSGRHADRLVVAVPEVEHPAAESRVRVVARAADDFHEPGILEIDSRSLSPGVTEVTVPLPRRTGRGARAHVVLKWDDGEGWDGTGDIVLRRGDIDVQTIPVRVIGGEGAAEGLVLGADHIALRVLGHRYEMGAGPREADEVMPLELTLTRPWELVVAPVFTGGQRELSCRWEEVERFRFGPEGWNQWPVVLRGQGTVSRELVFFDTAGIVRRETVDLEPGERRVLRPLIPPAEPVSEWMLEIAPVFEGRPRALMASVPEIGKFFSVGQWPFPVRGTRAGRITIRLSESNGTTLWSEHLSVSVGGSYLVSPRIPARPGEIAEADAPPAMIEGPGMLTGRVAMEAGAGPARIQVQVGRYPEVAEPPTLRNWFECEVAPNERFTIEGLPIGRYGAWILPDGRPPRFLRFRVRAEGETKPLLVDYGAGGSLEVVVRSLDGRTADGEVLEASGCIYDGGTSGMLWSGPRRQVTGRDGRGFFPDLQPGLWRVVWKPPGGEEMCRTVTISNGEAAILTFDLASKGAVRGRIRDAEGEALVDSIVEVWSGGKQIGRSTTNGVGRFAIENLDPGDCDLVVRRDGFAGLAASLRIVGGGTESIEARLRDTEISGHIFRAESHPDRRPWRVEVIRAARGEVVMALSTESAGGRFSFVGLPPGEWLLRFTADGDGGAVSMERRVELPPSGHLAGLSVEAPIG